MDNLEQRIKKLSPAKQELLKRRLKVRQPSSVEVPSIPRRGTSGSYPPSFAQQRLWFLHQLEPEVPVYNMPRAFNIRGQLNVDALRQALEAIIARHETLRTTFVAVDGEPVATIAQHWTFDLPVQDMSHWPKESWETEVRRRIEQEIRRPFDLAHDLMLRGMLFRIHDTEHILLLVKHHIATDFWSAGIFYRELSICYNAFSQGCSPSLPELPIQYADFAVWQREWLQGERINVQLAYWQRQLENVPILALPTDHPRPAMQTYQSARQSLWLSRRLTEAIIRLSKQERTTVFMTLLAAFKVLLSRYTGQTDLPVGTPIANRRLSELEGLIGFFVNTLVLRTDLAGNPSFLEFLKQVKQISLEAHDHQDLPFERLIGVRLHPRDFIHQTLGQIAVVCDEKRTMSQKPEPKRVFRTLWHHLKHVIFQRLTNCKLKDF